MAILTCHAAYHIRQETTTSTLRNISRSTSNREATPGERLSREVRNAAWKDTSLWLAMIQPRSRRAVSARWGRNVRDRILKNPMDFLSPTAEAPAGALYRTSF